MPKGPPHFIKIISQEFLNTNEFFFNMTKITPNGKKESKSFKEILNPFKCTQLVKKKKKEKTFYF